MHQINLFTLISTGLHAMRHKEQEMRLLSKSNLNMVHRSVVLALL